MCRLTCDLEPLHFLVLLLPALLTDAISFQFCNELFLLRVMVQYCVICWHRPRSDLVLVLLWNIECFGIEEEVLNGCFSGIACAPVPLNNKPPTY